MSEMNNNGEGMENIADDMLEEGAGGEGPGIYFQCSNPNCSLHGWRKVAGCGHYCPRCYSWLQVEVRE